MYCRIKKSIFPDIRIQIYMAVRNGNVSLNRRRNRMSRYWCSKCDHMYWGKGISYKGKLYCPYCFKQIRYKEFDKEVNADD